MDGFLLYSSVNTDWLLNRWRNRVIPAACIFNTRVSIFIALLLLEAAFNSRLQHDVAQRQPASLLSTVIFLQPPAPCLNHHRAEAEPARRQSFAWGNHFYITCGLQTGRRGMEGGSCCRKWQPKKKNQSFKINPVFLRKVWHSSNARVRVGKAERLHICTLHMLS